MYCPGHGVKGNDCVNRLTGKAVITSGLHLRSEVLRSLKHDLRAQSQGHHAIDYLEEIGTIFLGRTRRAVMKQTLETSERLVGVHIGFPMQMDSILNGNGVKR